MSTIVVGIDEAGYGPLLGPLCVGMSAFKLNQGTELDMWEVLAGAVCREPGRGGKADALGRVAVCDSKELKLSNSAKTVHPLVHLERGVLAFLKAGPEEHNISSDTELYRALRCTLAEYEDEHRNRFHHACYGGEATPLPLAQHAGQLALASALLRTHMTRAGVTLLALRAIAVGEADFNSLIRECNNKSETVIYAVGKHLRYIWETYVGTAERCGVVCDRLGGRASYGGLLEKEVPGASVQVLEETDRRSRYVVSQGSKRMGVAFVTESERVHLPVALASMTAKLVRELAMMRFNRYWNAASRDIRGCEIAPTAGYTTDARRFLAEIGDEVMGRTDREALVRLA